jgi:AraC-like DNA-binding protein
MESSIPSQYLLVLVAIALERGCTAETLFRNTGLNLNTLSTAGARVDEAQADQLIANALSATGDPALGLTVGQQLNMGAHAVVGQTFLACANLMEVLDTLVRYGPLLTGRQAQIEHYRDADNDRIGLMLRLTSPSPSVRFTHEAIFSAAQKTLSDLLQTPAIDLRVALPYEAPTDRGALIEVFGPDISFNSREAILTLPGSLMTTPLPTSNPTLRALYDAECARLLADLSDNATCTDRTLAALDRLEGQYPTLEQMASVLNMSARTYRRRLEEDGTSFQTLLDSTRFNHATQQLRHPERSVDQIAHRLGFSDVSNFRRAFIQWCGESPAQWRKKASERDTERSLAKR